MIWLSYGAGVNSTALAVLLAKGEVPGVGEEWTPIFADTGDEKPDTYSWLERWGIPYLREIGHPLVTVRPKETVLERWQRLSVTGSRRIRSCTDEAKIRPQNAYRVEHGGGQELIGIDAGEAHRATQRRGRDVRYPLVELDIDRDACVAIIVKAGIEVPPKSGCWHCPFMRVGEVLALAAKQPERFAVIEALEAAANAVHPSATGVPRTQWGDKPTSYWRERAVRMSQQQEAIPEAEPPCGCYDG